MLNAEIDMSEKIRNLSKNWAETILASVALVGDFKNCCMRQRKYDGSVRDYYFRE